MTKTERITTTNHPERGMHKMKNLINDEQSLTSASQRWLIQHGAASWHQRRAGHFYAASIILCTRAAAETWVAKYSKRNPGEPYFISPA